MSYKSDQEKTIYAFNNLVKPVLSKKFPGEYFVLEGIDSYLAKAFDIYAGIDVLYLNNEFGIRGIASRIQFDCNFRTFTIRARRDSKTKTELEKRLFAIKNDWLYPHLTLQAYIENNNLLSLAVTKTTTIYKHIEFGNCTERHTNVDQIGQAQFFAVSWDDFLEDSIYIYDNRSTT